MVSHFLPVFNYESFPYTLYINQDHVAIISVGTFNCHHCTVYETDCTIISLFVLLYYGEYEEVLWVNRKKYYGEYIKSNNNLYLPLHR